MPISALRDEALALVQVAGRRALKSPGLTLTTAATIGLAIAAASVIFTITDSLLLRPLPFPDSQQLAIVAEVRTDGPASGAASYPLFADLRQALAVFRYLAVHRHQALNLTANGLTEQVESQLVSREFFAVLGIPASYGATFEHSRANRGVVISESMAEHWFGSGPLAVGRMVAIEGVSYPVAAVMPPGFHYPSDSNVWMLLDSGRPEQGEEMNSRGTRQFTMIGRLKPGSHIEQAQSEADVMESRIASDAPARNPWRIRVVSLQENMTGGFRPAVLLLMAAVGLVLLIACANVGWLSLAQSLARRQELAIRTALGASRSRLRAQLIAENLLQTLIGGIGGCALAAIGLKSVLQLAPVSLPLMSEMHVGWRTLVFVAVISVGAGMLSALPPALQVRDTGLNPFLNEMGHGLSGPSRMRRGLVAAEITLSVVLLCGATLLIESFLRLQRVDPGFRLNQLSAVQLVRPIPRTPLADGNYALWIGYQERMLSGIRAIPGVEAAAAAITLPLEGHKWISPFDLPDFPAGPDEHRSAEERLVSANYFSTVGIPLLRGRYFSDRDVRDTPRCAIVNRAFVERYLPAGNPIGRQIEVKAFSIGRAEIVGVVGNVHEYLMSETPKPEMYHLYSQVPMPFMTLVIRSRVDASALAAGVRHLSLSIDPQQPVGRLEMLTDRLAESMAYPRFQAILLALFAAFALLLVVIGLYSLAACSVERRVKEIGIRMALGARASAIRWMVLRETVVVTTLGLAAGIPFALAFGQAMRGAVFVVTVTDPSVYILVSLGLAVVALLGALMPAIRATRISCSLALRHD